MACHPPGVLHLPAASAAPSSGAPFKGQSPWQANVMHPEDPDTSGISNWTWEKGIRGTWVVSQGWGCRQRGPEASPRQHAQVAAGHAGPLVIH